MGDSDVFFYCKDLLPVVDHHLDCMDFVKGLVCKGKCVSWSICYSTSMVYCCVYTVCHFVTNHVHFPWLLHLSLCNQSWSLPVIVTFEGNKWPFCSHSKSISVIIKQIYHYKSYFFNVYYHKVTGNSTHLSESVASRKHKIIWLCCGTELDFRG